jgi:hypothetical protein
MQAIFVVNVVSQQILAHYQKLSMKQLVCSGANANFFSNLL